MAFLFAVFFLIPIMLAFAGFIFSFFILDFGIDGIFLDNLRGRDTTLKIRKIRSYSICWASFLRFFYLALWAMLFFFPAVVKYYSYIFVPYIAFYVKIQISRPFFLFMLIFYNLCQKAACF